jgi:hypothetical protein
MSDQVRTLNGIVRNGGKRAAYRRISGIDSDGVITATGAWIDMVYRFKSSMPLKQPIEGVKDEAGDEIITELGDKEYSIKIFSLQSDASLVDFLVDEVGNNFQLFIEFGNDRAGQKREMFCPLVNFELDTIIEYPSPRPEFNIKMLMNQTAHIPATVPTWAVGSAANFETAANRGFKSLET